MRHITASRASPWLMKRDLLNFKFNAPIYKTLVPFTFLTSLSICPVSGNMHLSLCKPCSCYHWNVFHPECSNILKCTRHTSAHIMTLSCKLSNSEITVMLPELSTNSSQDHLFVVVCATGGKGFFLKLCIALDNKTQNGAINKGSGNTCKISRSSNAA